MESKSRRAPRVPGPIAPPAEPVAPVETPAIAVGPAEPSSQPPEPAQLRTEAVKLAETALDVLTTAAGAASLSSIATPHSIAKHTPPNEITHSSRDALTALAQSQAALSRGLEALSAEIVDLTLSGIDSATRTATKMLSVKTLSDAVAVNAGFTASSFDRLVGSSVKLSELSLKLATETSQPILSQIGKGWITPSRGRS